MRTLTPSIQSQPGQLPGQLGQRRGDVAAQLEGGLVVVVDIGGHFVDVDQRAGRIRIPQPGIVFDRVVADRHQHIGVADHDVAGLVAEQSDAPDEPVFQFARHHAGSLERLDNRQIGDRDQLAQRRTWCGLAGANADEQSRVLCGPNQVDGLCNWTSRCGTQRRHRGRLDDCR